MGTWDETLGDLAARREAARAMGGPDKLAARPTGGDRLDARRRLDHLLDPGSFTELGTLVGEVPADALVAGSGLIGGRPVMVGAEDFTVVGGTIGPGSNSKRHRLAELALRDRIPLVMLLEGAGYRADGRGQSRSPTDLLMQARCSGLVPIVTAVLGPSAGHGALIAPMSDFTVMTEAASIFTAGPPVVAEATGEEVSKEELGGPAVAVASGLIHNVAADDTAALDQIRTYLSFVGSSAWSYPPDAPGADTAPRPTPQLLDVVPRDHRRVYDMGDVLAAVVDEGRSFGVQPGFGRSIICALAHLGGHPVAIVANQPKVQAGAIDAAAADKAARFIAVADSFHLPLVFFADNPGMLPGSASERAGILRAGARMFAAQTTACTPKLHVTLRKNYGFGSLATAMVSFDGQDATFAYPGVTLGAMGAGAAAQASGADDDLTDELRRQELAASYRAAGGLGFDEVIDPGETRTALLTALERALHRRQAPAQPVSRTALTP